MSNFKLNKTTTWGITQDPKHKDRYQLPLVIRNKTVLKQLQELCEKNNFTTQLYGNNPDYKTMYLSIPKFLLSDATAKELVEQGKQEITITFNLHDVYKNPRTNKNHPNWRVTELTKF